MTTGQANILEKGSRFKKLLAISATALIASVALATPAWAGASEGRRIEVNYAIDYVLLEGHPDADVPVRIEVFRNATATPDSGVRIGSFEGTTSPDPQGRAGNILEVNHIGGGQFPNGDCWAPPATPDILPGDKVQATILTGANAGEVDYTFVRNINYTDINGVFEGTATGVENADGTFDVNAPITLTPGGEEGVGAIMEGKRVGGSAGDQEAEIFPDDNGFFSVPVPGTGGEAFIDYLIPNADNTATVEGDQATTAEPSNGPPGEAVAGCPALARTAMTDISREVINFDNQNQDLTVGGPVQDGVTVDSVSIGGQNVDAANISQANGAWTATIPAALFPAQDGNVDIVATFGGGAAPPAQTKTILKDTLAPGFDANLAPASGSYDAPFDLSLNTDDQNAEIFYTTNGTDPATSNSKLEYQGGDIAINRSMQFRAVAFDSAGNKSAELVRDYTIRTATRTSLAVSQKAIKLNARKAISGAVSPANAGTSVRLTIVRPGADLVVTRPLVNGRFSYSYRATVAGTHRVKATFLKDADSLGSTSAIRTFRVVR